MNKVVTNSRTNEADKTKLPLLQDGAAPSPAYSATALEVNCIYLLPIQGSHWWQAGRAYTTPLLANCSTFSKMYITPSKSATLKLHTLTESSCSTPRYQTQMQRKIVLKQTFSCMLFQTCCVPELNHLGSPSHNLNVYTMQCKMSTTLYRRKFSLPNPWHAKTLCTLKRLSGILLLLLPKYISTFLYVQQGHRNIRKIFICP